MLLKWSCLLLNFVCSQQCWTVTFHYKINFFAEDAAITTSPRYHQELHENLRHTDFSGSKSNPDAVHDRNQEQVQVKHATKR